MKCNTDNGGIRRRKEQGTIKYLDNHPHQVACKHVLMHCISTYKQIFQRAQTQWKKKTVVHDTDSIWHSVQEKR